MKIQLHQIPLITAICSEVDRQAAEEDCTALVNADRLNVIIAAANTIVASWGRDETEAIPRA